MDPVSLIVAALAAGAVAGAQDTASQGVKDAYAGLKRVVTRLFDGRASGETALERHESRPEEWQAALEAELIEVDAGQDPQVVAAAHRVMALIDPSGSQAGKYSVDVRGAQGVVVGDGNVQTNTFSTPPPAT